MSILTLAVARSDGGLTPAIVIVTAIFFIILLLVVAYFLKERKPSQLDHSAQDKFLREQKKLREKLEQEELERVFKIEDKVEKAMVAPGLDQTDELLSEALDKARKTK